MGVRTSKERQTSESDGDVIPEAPPLSADVFVFANERCRAQITPLVPDEITVREFESADKLVEAASGNLALTLVSAHQPEPRIEQVVRETLCASQHARVGLVAGDGAPILRCDVPHDDSFVLSQERDTLQTAIRHLYIRAYYSVTLDRYYKISISIENNERTPGENDAEQLQKLSESRDRVFGYLRLFRNFLNTDDFADIATREDRFDVLVDAPRRRGNPDVVGLPDSCPDCNLDWTDWHGPRLEKGYERIGANTYRCTACGHTLADNDPDNYRVG